MTTCTRPDVRLATAQDAAELAALIHSAYRGESSRRGWTTEADLLDGPRIDVEGVLEVIEDPDSLLLVFPDEQGVLACCQLEDRGDGLVYFGLFAVRPGHQGAGVGSRVIAEAQRYARRAFSSTTMEMTVIGQRVELIAWYERLGFVVTGETRPFPYGNPRAGTPRRDDLHFAVLRQELEAE